MAGADVEVAFDDEVEDVDDEFEVVTFSSGLCFGFVDSLELEDDEEEGRPCLDPMNPEGLSL